MRPFILLPLAAAGLAAAQTVNPNSVDQSTRDAWCNDQTSACPILCSQTTQSTNTESNTCQASTLAWTCVCSDGTVPNGTQYSMPIPFHECQEYVVQCVQGCGQNNQCASDCQKNNPCGAQAPTRVNATSTTSTAASTSTSTGSFGTFGGSTNGAGVAFRAGEVFGLGFVAAALFAGFALIV